MPRALRSYNKFPHMRDYARVNRMEVPEWKNRMEIVEKVDCNGWPFWASVLYREYNTTVLSDSPCMRHG